MKFGKKKKDPVKKVEYKDEPEDENPMKKMAEEKENETKERFVVVKELPREPVRQVKAEDGSIVNLITTEEALTKFINEEEE